MQKIDILCLYRGKHQELPTFFKAQELFRAENESEVSSLPALLGKEVCICRENDIIIACTYEAKRKGVGTSSQIVYKCYYTKFF